MDLTLELKEQTILKERARLFNFIRGKVSSQEEAEDILQDVLFVFIDRYVLEDVEKAAGWLFSVARNKIVDRYRRRKFEASSIDRTWKEGEDTLSIKDMIPDLGNTPEDDYLRNLIWEEIWTALEELPEAQRWVFIQNELEDRSFREMAEETGLSINTLLSRKRYAVLALRDRLEDFYNDLTS